MGAGTWVLAGLLLAVGATPPDVAHVSARELSIPIRLDPSLRGQIRELMLFSSADQGQQWQKVGVAGPEKPAFTFYAPADGEYWFSVAAIDRDGNQSPRDITKAPPSTKIMVDTVRPDVRSLLAERQGDEIVVRWEIQEEYPDWNSLKLEYHTAEMAAGQWAAVAGIQPSVNQVAFRPNSTGPVTVRLQVKDLAENVGQGQTEVAAAPAPPTSSGAQSALMPPPLSPPANAGTPALTPPASAGAPPSQPLQMPTSNSERSWSPVQQATMIRPAPSWSSPQPIIPGPNTGNQLVASSTPRIERSSAFGAPGGARPERSPLPPAKMVGTTQVTLHYEVTRYGSSGLDKVDLFITRDDGLTWQHYGEERIALTQLADAKALSGSLQRSVTVTLPEDGVYGFWLIVKSGAGKGRREPKSGDVPDMRVEVDTKPPVAELFAPELDPEHRDGLVFHWTATDTNLTRTPITLEWSDRKGGEWHYIGAPEMENTGQFAWKVPLDIPSKVFLRLTVRDTAGNVAVAETNETVVVDLNEPEVKFTGVGPRSRP
jgi:hypothetical protein